MKQALLLFSKKATEGRSFRLSWGMSEIFALQECILLCKHQIYIVMKQIEEKF